MNKANRLVGLIRTFVSLDGEIFKYLFVSIVRLDLEYANKVWAPYLIQDIEAIENVERRASNLIPTLKNLSYEDRLRKVGVPTLSYRRARGRMGDMIKTFNILTGVYEEDVSHDVIVIREHNRTRGHVTVIPRSYSRKELRL